MTSKRINSLIIGMIVFFIIGGIASTVSAQSDVLYFPHIDVGGFWETEICILNSSSSQKLNATLEMYTQSGSKAGPDETIELDPMQRDQIMVGTELTNASDIRYMILRISSGTAVGYTKFYVNGMYRVAIPAVSQVNTSDISVSHIASDVIWWTGISLVNTTDNDKTLTFRFNTGQTAPVQLNKKEHKAFLIKDLLGGSVPDAVDSALIENGSGIVGLELFGGANQLSGILLRDVTDTQIHYPHVVSDTTWWTGIVVHNPSGQAATLTFLPYRADGTSLTSFTLDLPAYANRVDLAQDLNLPDGTDWFTIQSTVPVTGFELFGSKDGKLLGGYTAVGMLRQKGMFPKLETQGWTGIAFVNVDNATATVTLTARDDAGWVVAYETFELGPHRKRVDVAPNLFSQSIAGATYIEFESSGSVAGFQLNGSSDGMLLDALPAIGSSTATSEGNHKPVAESVTVRTDYTVPYLVQQLSGSDADGDVLSYELMSSITGTGYDLAYLDRSDGQLYVTLAGDGTSSFSLAYRVTDGMVYSDPGYVSVEISQSTDDNGTGRIDVNPETYSAFQSSVLESSLLGVPGSSPTYPSSMDLSGNFPEPGDQGQQNSCVGWATAYALKSYQEKVEIGWSLNTYAHLFSPAFIYNQINNGQDSGSYIFEALDLIVNSGAATLATMPYSDNDYTSQPGAAARQEAANYKGRSWYRVSSTSQAKAALVNRMPVVAGIQIYPSFNRLYGANSVYNTADGAVLGGHAVTIVGYDDNRYGGAFKVINSYGLGWGDEGYFWMPYSFAASGVLMEAYVLEDAENSQTPVIDEPTEPEPYGDLPNFQIVSWSADYDPRPNGTGSLQYEIVNAGEAVASSGADVNLMLSVNNEITPNDIYVVYENIQFDLEPGYVVYRDNENPIQFSFPDSVPEGTYYMALWVDDLGEVTESDETDNISLGSNLVTIENNLPDLVVTTWYAWWDGYGNGNLTYKVTNQGNATAQNTNWDINLILSPDEQVANNNEIYLFYEDAGYTLEPGTYVYRDDASAASFSLYVDAFGSPVPSGTYYMALWVDDLDQVAESNELNNYSFGWNTISIGGRQAKRGSAGGRAYNGKQLPPTSVVTQKITITDLPDGGRSVQFHDAKPVRGMDTTTETGSKTISASTHAIFPIIKRVPMPDTVDRTGK